MKLRKLNLISFGKFKNYSLELEDGLNIIYGENESGKTTIHNFIEGMFYGFQSPNATTRKKPLEEKAKYNPWHEDSYKGILTFEKDGKTYRIERDFKSDKVRVFDDLTGRDITDEIDNGERIKIHLPGLHFFKFNSYVYRNTIAIRQLENRVDSQLAREVKDKLINMTTAMDDTISVNNAINELDDMLAEIGTERAYTQPYAMAKKKLSSLMEKRRENLQKKEEFNQVTEEYSRIKKEMEEKKEEIESLKELLNKAIMAKMKRDYEEALRIKSDLEEIDRKIEELKPYSNIREEDYHSALKIQGDIRVLEGEIKAIHDNTKSMESQLKGLQEEIIEKEDKVYSDIFDDYAKYNELEEERSSLFMKSQKNRMDILSSEIKQAEEKVKGAKMQRIVFSVAALIFLGLTFINRLFAAGAALGIIFAVYSSSSYKDAKNKVQSLQEELSRLKSEEDSRNGRIAEIDSLKADILKKYSLSSKSELSRLYEDQRFSLANRTSISNQIQELIIIIMDLSRELEQKTSEKENLERNLADLLSRNGLESIDSFKAALDKKRNYNSLLADRSNKLELYKRVIGNTTLEELESKIIDTDVEAVDRDADEIRAELEGLEEEYNELTNEYSRIEVKLETLNNYVTELIEIEEEIEAVKSKIESMERKIKAINTAKEAILKISADIHNEFAPRINRDVSMLISEITDGKYTNVKIDEDFSITVENPVSNETIYLDSLSGGTMDQIHFALRFSLISSIKDERLPLILDDCFIQYDDKRLENILKYIDKACRDMQILLFTCQNREKEILDRLNLKYNLIALG